MSLEMRTPEFYGNIRLSNGWVVSLYGTKEDLQQAGLMDSRENFREGSIISIVEKSGADVAKYSHILITTEENLSGLKLKGAGDVLVIHVDPYGNVKYTQVVALK